MNTPVFLAGAVLLFWGLQTGHYAIAALIALALEGSRLITTRIHFSDKDYSRIMDLCVYLCFGVVAFTLVTDMDHISAMRMSVWMPVLLLPLMLAQVYGVNQGINLSALSLIVRRRKKKSKKEGQATKSAGKRINISFAYLAVCLISSGMGNNRSSWLFLILMGLMAWALWANRNRGWSIWSWMSLLVVVVVFGFAAQLGLQELQRKVERKVMEYIGGGGSNRSDPFQSRTSIGSIGKMKLSDAIVFRVRTESDAKPPGYLRKSDYNVYSVAHSTPTWHAVPRKSDPLQPSSANTAGTSWQLRPLPNDGEEGQLTRLTISTRFQGGNGVLPVPIRAVSLADLPADTVSLSKLGAVQVSGVPGLVHVQVWESQSLPQEPAVTEMDLLVPDALQPMLKKVMRENGLAREHHPETGQAISSFFRDHFFYSLVQKKQDMPVNTHKGNLEHFLTKSRAGHCEFFAASTVLMARIAGIPSRYATGWVVGEYSELEQAYLIRSRHAHAWAMLFLDGHWQVLDTTPADWLEQEEEQTSLFTPIRDFISWCCFRFVSWRDKAEMEIPAVVYWPLLGFFLLLLYGFVRKRKKQQQPQQLEVEQETDKKGLDSDFFRIEQQMTLTGYGRHQTETLQQWLSRLNNLPEQDFDLRSLSDILRLHYQYRFDPQCDSVSCRQQLSSMVDRWITAQ